MHKIEREALKAIAIGAGVVTDFENVTDAEMEAYDRFAKMVMTATVSWMKDTGGKLTTDVDNDNQPLTPEADAERNNLTHLLILALSNRDCGVIEVTESEVDAALEKFDGFALSSDNGTIRVEAGKNTKERVEAIAAARKHGMH